MPRLSLMWLSDIVSIITAFLLAYWLRQLSLPPPIQPIAFYIPLIVVAIILFLFSFTFFRLYERKRILFSLSYLVDYLQALFLWAVLLIAFAFLTKTNYSRGVILLFFGFTAILTIGTRFFLEWIFPSSQSRPGDIDVLRIVGDITRLSRISPDNLRLLEGLNSRNAPNIFYIIMKRFLDVIIATAGLIVVLPFFPLIALYIRSESSGKVVIRQDRIGKNGKRFMIYKFRTMIVDTELYASAPRNNHDPRITRVGNFLRKYSLDELPQLWNVLKGEMSIVGPRPEMPFIVEKYEPWQKVRLEVKPGITGLWQILGRKDLPLEENIEYDLYYVFNQSLFLDLAIIFKTIPHLLFSRGAY